jgi:hypothetical protein
MRRLLLLVLVVCCGYANAEVELDTGPKPVDARSMAEGAAGVPAKDWYMGASFGVGQLTGWNSDAVATYYRSNGYGSRSTASSENSMQEVKFYAGNHARDFMDIEFGASFGQNFGGPAWSRYYSTRGTGEITSTRAFNTYVLYAATTFMPVNARWVHIKLGAHLSQLEIVKTVTGSAPNLTAIAAGDNMSGDGVSAGGGPLIALGFDFRTGKAGAIRLELNRYFMIGGTSYSLDSLNLGYHVNFR